MNVQKVKTDLLSSNMYIISERGKALIIDPERDCRLPDGLRPELIILTHEHYDHIAGVNIWRERFQIPVFCSETCNLRMQNPKKNLSRYFEAFCGLQEGLDGTLPDDYDPDYVCKADRVFSTDTTIEWNGHEVELFILPGHSPGSIGIRIENCLFSGDSIFLEQKTVLHFPGGSEKDWRETSLPKIRKIPGETTVYPGHFDQFKLCEWKHYREENEIGFFRKSWN